MTSEERRRRLAEMSADAETHLVSRIQRLEKKEKQDEADELQDRRRETDTGNSSFVSDLQRSVYSVDGNAGPGNQSHLRRRRHFHQKNPDSESFMRRE